MASEVLSEWLELAPLHAAARLCFQAPYTCCLVLSGSLLCMLAQSASHPLLLPVPCLTLLLLLPLPLSFCPQAMRTTKAWTWTLLFLAFCSNLLYMAGLAALQVRRAAARRTIRLGPRLHPPARTVSASLG